MKRYEYTVYTDTDSLFIKIWDFLEHQGLSRDDWLLLPLNVRTEYIIKISKIIENDVNDRSYNEIQRIDFNSSVDENFAINFKQEIVCPTAIFLAPKMYCFHTVNDEGFECDRIDAKGVEIVRSNSPTVFRSALKELVERLLKGDDNDTLMNLVEKHKENFYSAKPEDISTNIGVNGLTKWVNLRNECIKGTPYHVRAASNYHWLLDELGIDKKYERIKEGDKIKLCYVKPNKYSFDYIAYYDWPHELTEAGIFVDYDKMIDKYFISKADIILSPIGREKILGGYSIENDFF